MPPDVQEAFAYCGQVVRSHYENFPVGGRLAPRRLRPHIWSVYAFARAADDFADEARHAGRRLAELDLWESRLDRCLRGEADHPVFVALRETIRTFELPDQPLRDLLDAFRQDCRVRRYASWEELLDYCRRSANPIGRLVLHLFGHRDDERRRLSDAICTALQLTNFWQDVAVDLRKDRIYLPAEDRERHSVTEQDLREGRLHEGYRALLKELIGRTRRSFEAGKPLVSRVGVRLGLELRVVWLGGQRVLDKIERAGGNAFSERAILGGADRVAVVGRALLGRWAMP